MIIKKYFKINLIFSFISFFIKFFHNQSYKEKYF